jgi:hypothetical protein
MKITILLLFTLLAASTQASTTTTNLASQESILALLNAEPTLSIDLYETPQVTPFPLVGATTVVSDTIFIYQSANNNSKKKDDDDDDDDHDDDDCKDHYYGDKTFPKYTGGDDHDHDHDHDHDDCVPLVPESSTWAAIIIGLVGMAIVIRPKLLQGQNKLGKIKKIH